ncbi:pol polyprotein [Acanthamoeba castellanii str. Neff]|uniref:Pol polyprotein n=1 Tax=Acanthamoeba castellanii (strain ATCC 30010 / Neff) TaxID=1257118 RepID=L8H9F1_ACACF|nr:pol polyprotein [Acanthamoeba castellanii str. Neff]ELR21882.1 pol polyprotein [Acanthamoeba castellanii str. Neff]
MAFSVSSRLYKFNVMPFGLTNTPALFQWNMEALLRGLTWSCCLMYIDNIVIYSQSWPTYRPSLTISSRDRCLKPDPTKVATVKDTQPPQSAQEAHQEAFETLKQHLTAAPVITTATRLALYTAHGRLGTRHWRVVFEWVKAYQHYLHGHHFTVVTDHNPLVWISTQHDPQLAQWALTLQEHNF